MIIKAEKILELEELFKRNDFDLNDSEDTAKLALLMFSDRIVKYISWYINLISPDAIVFTGGIGENAWQIRKLVGIGIHANINHDKNIVNETLFGELKNNNNEKSNTKLMIIPTNEELQMVREIKEQINEL